jgi:hypothetical protein
MPKVQGNGVWMAEMVFIWNQQIYMLSYVHFELFKLVKSSRAISPVNSGKSPTFRRQSVSVVMDRPRRLSFLVHYYLLVLRVPVECLPFRIFILKTLGSVVSSEAG